MSSHAADATTAPATNAPAQPHGHGHAQPLLTTYAQGASPAGVPLYGVMAEYDNEHDVVHAARRMYELGYRRMDGFTPIPVHGLDEAIGRRRTRLPLLVLMAGITGAVGGFSMMAYSAAVHYPINVAGRPYISWPMFIPITFECTILLASLTAVFAMLGLNGLPQPYHPTFNVPEFVRASANSFFLCVEATDPLFDPARLKADFETTHPRFVHEVPE